MSSDDQLNRMWYAGAYTTQMDMVPAGVASCFTQPVIFDGAKRDRAIWSGDLMITNPVAQLSLGTNSVPYVKGSIDAIMNLQAVQRPADQRGRVPRLRRLRLRGDLLGLLGDHRGPVLPLHRTTPPTSPRCCPRLEAATAYHATRLNANGLDRHQRQRLLADHPERRGHRVQPRLLRTAPEHDLAGGQGRHRGQGHRVHQQGQRPQDRDQLPAVQRERRALRAHQHPDQRVPAGREHERDPPRRRPGRAGAGHPELLQEPVAGARKPDHATRRPAWPTRTGTPSNRSTTPGR